MANFKYRPRVVDKTLRSLLSGIGAVVIEGPKGCGKTTTGEQQAKSILALSSALARKTTIDLLGYNPKGVLAGATPKLIDEWQVIPTLWDEIRTEIDRRQAAGQFILTGSAVPADRSDIFHTGTGRFAWLTMHTMSIFESGESSGEISISSLFDGEHDVFAQNNLSIESLAHATCRGGWPQAVNLDGVDAIKASFKHIDAIARSETSRIGTKKDFAKTGALLRAYARNLGTQASIPFITQDALSLGNSPFSIRTCHEYLKALREIFVIEDMPAWVPKLRTTTAVRTSDTRYFTDPSIGAAALQIGPKDLLQDPKSFGFLFENLCIRDLRVYAQALDAEVFHYRDRNNLRCDAVMHRKNGTYGLIEIKLGGLPAIDHGAKTLLELAGKIDTTKMPKPSFLMVLVGAGPCAYRRKDGVLVVPIGCLKP